MYRDIQYYWWRKLEYSEKAIDLQNLITTIHHIDNIRPLSRNIEFICTCLETGKKSKKLLNIHTKRKNIDILVEFFWGVKVIVFIATFNNISVIF